MESQNRNRIRQFISRKSPFSETCIDSQQCDEIFDFLFKECKVLVVGAGGLGCELLKNLAYMGFRDIEVIDMDTIELSNLNRQFLFQTKDIGKSKAQVAAAKIMQRMSDCKVVPRFNKIQDFNPNYYRQFNLIICGLDSVEARRWINNTLCSLLVYDDDGNLDQSSVIPLIDGGTEGLQGNARLILPGLTSCIECNLDLYPAQVSYPVCTLANLPRLPEHCIEYAKTLLWDREQPFGKDVALDTDNAAHIDWIHQRAVVRAREHQIEEPSFRFTQGVVKQTIAAVSSTNSCIAATCVLEAFKLVTSCANKMNNYQMLNMSHGVYTYVFETEKQDDCLACSRQTRLALMNKEQNAAAAAASVDD